MGNSRGTETSSQGGQGRVDFRTAFKAMSQAALWVVMEELNIPNVDLLKSLYAQAPVRLQPNGGENGKDDREATLITFDTGSAG